MPGGRLRRPRQLVHADRRQDAGRGLEGDLAKPAVAEPSPDRGGQVGAAPAARPDHPGARGAEVGQPRDDFLDFPVRDVAEHPTKEDEVGR